MQEEKVKFNVLPPEWLRNLKDPEHPKTYAQTIMMFIDNLEQLGISAELAFTVLEQMIIEKTSHFDHVIYLNQPMVINREVQYTGTMDDGSQKLRVLGNVTSNTGNIRNGDVPCIHNCANFLNNRCRLGLPRCRRCPRYRNAKWCGLRRI